ncbi:MAG: 23S rRNA (uracil(1939)-C(5))-methyltransferase RlmD [Candidatus Eremiobacteraeota bacterium]|nr:23S rRNA (uracil(1939)-C(5))-methyltransferase RlmD [Candidatus Eremiobacteraeota bacterium]
MSKLRSQLVTFEDWSRRGETRARGQNGWVLASGGIPGEQAACWVGRKRKGGRQAWIREVLEPSQDRVEPRCPHFGICGGCTHQHLDYPRQLADKAAQVYSMLPEVPCLAPVPAPSPWFYRSKVEFSLLESRRGLEVGFNRRGKFDWLVEVARCYIGPPENAAVLARVRAWAARHDLRGWDPRGHTGSLRYLILRRSSATGQWLACLVATPHDDEGPFEELAGELSALGATGVVLIRQTSVAGAVVPDSERLLAGSPFIEERLEDLSFQLSWRSFFQVNPPAYVAMLREARDWLALEPETRVLDLFCGIGTIGLFLTRGAGRLTGVESIQAAVEDARASALRNGCQAEFHCADAGAWPLDECDLLVLDPPRSGCHPKLVERVAREGPQRVLYISCNPARLVEELDTLGRHYRVAKCRAYDFFPNTRHLELLALLERN